MTDETLRLDEKSAVVTGSSRGIGAAIARKLAEAGASVVLSAPEDEEEELREVRDEIIDADHDGTAVYTYCDVTDRDAVAALGEETVDKFGSVDILVNNAGGGIPAPMEDIDAELWNKVISLNLGGTFNCINTIGRQMTEHGGSIVNVASMAGVTGYPGMSPYAASKAAIINLTRSIACEWSVYDVRVNAIAPGSVATERIADRLDHPSADEIDRETVARRVGKPEEIADVVRFLASPAASYVTAETYNVAGVPNFERRREVLDVNDGSSTII
jgi:3-oxoacyl-[acyl-carrier protein] reductase